MSASPSPVVEAARRQVPRYMRATGNLQTDVQAKRRAARATRRAARTIQVPEASIQVVELAEVFELTEVIKPTEVIELTEVIENFPTKIVPEIQEAVAGSKSPSDDFTVNLVPGIQVLNKKVHPTFVIEQPLAVAGSRFPSDDSTTSQSIEQPASYTPLQAPVAGSRFVQSDESTVNVPHHLAKTVAFESSNIRRQVQQGVLDVDDVPNLLKNDEEREYSSFYGNATPKIASPDSGEKMMNKTTKITRTQMISNANYPRLVRKLEFHHDIVVSDVVKPSPERPTGSPLRHLEPTESTKTRAIYIEAIPYTPLKVRNENIKRAAAKKVAALRRMRAA